MKQTRKARIVVHSNAQKRYSWDLYAPNGRLIAESPKWFPTQQATVKYLEALAAKGVLGNAVVVAG